MTSYDRDFYLKQAEGSLKAARRILPLVFQWLAPASVLDLGCGCGTWLAACQELGVTDVAGIDGPWVERSLLMIDEKRFGSGDLTHPVYLHRTFDLAISVEVAEHLPSEYEHVLVESLTRHAPVVLFAAGIPFAGGDHHVNERWQSHWAELFALRGYDVIDCIRPVIWNDPDIAWWYAQDCLVFVRKDWLKDHTDITVPQVSAMPLDVIHPRCYVGVADPSNMSLRRFGRACPYVARRILRKITHVTRTR